MILEKTFAFFAPGSMRPKIEAMIEFIESGGREAMLTDPPNLLRALSGETGTTP